MTSQDRYPDQWHAGGTDEERRSVLREYLTRRFAVTPLLNNKDGSVATDGDQLEWWVILAEAALDRPGYPVALPEQLTYDWTLAELRRDAHGVERRFVMAQDVIRLLGLEGFAKFGDF